MFAYTYVRRKRMKPKIAVSWSGGKDSTLALFKLLQDDQYEVDCLVTTITEEVNRISIHGVRESLLELQAAAIGLKLYKIYIPLQCTNELYEERMLEGLNKLKEQNIHHMMFGDIFLEDVRQYREALIAKVGLVTVFPLWGASTATLIKEFIDLKFKTITTCIDTEKLGDEFLGKIIDESFILSLPVAVDACGENGEFHTFTYEGPLFSRGLEIEIGEKVDKGRFHFCDLK